MDLLQTILNAQGGQAVDQLGAQFGLNRDQTVAAVQNLLPALATGVTQNTATPGGLESLLGALTRGNHQQYMENPSALASESARLDGNGILGHVLGSKDVSRQVASRAAARTGIGDDILKKMLPLVASLVMGAMSKRATQNPGGLTAGSGGGGLLDMLTPMLDQDRDGSVMDDLLGKLGGAFRK